MKEALPAYQDTIKGAERSVIDLLKIQSLIIADPLRICNWDRALDINVGDGFGTQIFSALPFRRETIKTHADLTVDDVTISVPNAELQLALDSDATPTVTSISELTIESYFTGAEISLYQYDIANNLVFHHSDWVVSAVPAVTRVGVVVQLRSFIAKLQAHSPKTVIQEQCNSQLFDIECGLVASAHEVSGTALSGTRCQIWSELTEPAGWFSLGSVRFTSGANIGLSRQVVSYGGGTFLLSAYLPTPVAGGDGFTAVPGCNKTTNQCLNKFNNLARFRGFPYVPQPEVVT